ncbi:MAG: response regulator [Bacteroidia bacterium]
MKKLLIHSNNTSFNNTELFPLAEQFVFDVDFDKDVDFYINENLTDGGLKQKLEKCDIVFIKVSLSKNYLEYLGLRLAYHIRLTKSIGTKAYMPIVFIAEESFQYLGLTHPEPSIFFTKGIYLIKESLDDYKKTLKWFIDGRIKPLDDFSSFVNSIIINPPSNYLSHHSIANEWSILRWAKVLGIATEVEALKDVRINIESLLYYKFLQAKYPIEAEPDKAAFKINGKGRILYIDDEWNKGWNVVLSNYFATSSTEIKFETLKYDFKDRSHQDILKECDKKIQSFKPDVVLLDLRLSDSDFTNSHNSSLLTGYKVLNAIKLINPGIQVIIFTASNKVWNLLELQANGADGFLLKESPELTINSSYTYEALSSLSKQITICLSNAYLKEIWNLFEEIKKVFSKNPLTTKYFPRHLKEQLNGIKYQNLLLQELDAIFEILKTNNENRYGMAMIMLYKILEYLNEIFYQKIAWDEPPKFFDNVPVDYFDKNSKAWKKPTDRLDYYNREKRVKEQIRIKPEWLKSTLNKTLNLAVKKLNITDDSILIDLISLSDYRNDFIHSDSSKRSMLKVLQSKEILKWSTSVTSIIKNL